MISVNLSKEFKNDILSERSKHLRDGKMIIDKISFSACNQRGTVTYFHKGVRMAYTQVNDFLDEYSLTLKYNTPLKRNGVLFDEICYKLFADGSAVSLYRDSELVEIVSSNKNEYQIDLGINESLIGVEFWPA